MGIIINGKNASAVVYSDTIEDYAFTQIKNICDNEAANLLREAYADDLASLEGFEEAMLVDGLVVHVAGMRVMALGGFEAALSDARQKQVMWARLKQLPPLGEPY